jgi:hypothetical protein
LRLASSVVTVQNQITRRRYRRIDAATHGSQDNNIAS